MLRSRFQSLPGAFNACLIPNENTKEKGIKLAFSRKCHKVCFLLLLYGYMYIWNIKIYEANLYLLKLKCEFSVSLLLNRTHFELLFFFLFQIPNTNGKEAKQFSQMWNTIINSFREEDLISNRLSLPSNFRPFDN